MSSTCSSDIKLAIFDLDGTLVNTIADLGSSMSFALSSLGLPTRTMEEYTRFVGNGTLLLAKRSLPDECQNDEEFLNKAHSLFSEYYSDHFADNSKVYDGMLETLTELKSRGVKLCVNTNKPDRFSKKLIKLLFPEGTFDIVIGSREGVAKKPDPVTENEIIGALGVKPSEVIHIGDSDVDVYTAHNAGIKCIGCTWGFRSRESLISANADFLADKPEDILKFAEKSAEKI